MRTTLATTTALLALLGAACAVEDEPAEGSPTTTAAPTTAEAPASTEAPTTTEAPAPTTTEAPSEPASVTNARRSAENYIDMTGFSRSGLIEQLEFEGYSASDAAAAIDSMAIDWNEQAARSAESYVDMTGFSRSGLIEQLEFEGYTAEQAAHGADSVGL